MDLWEKIVGIDSNVWMILTAMTLCAFGGISLSHQKIYYQLIREKDYSEAKNSKQITFYFKMGLIILSSIYSVLKIGMKDVDSVLTIIAIAAGLLSIQSAFDSQYKEEYEIELKINEERKRLLRKRHNRK